MPNGLNIAKSIYNSLCLHLRESKLRVKSEQCGDSVVLIDSKMFLMRTENTLCMYARVRRIYDGFVVGCTILAAG